MAAAEDDDDSRVCDGPPPVRCCGGRGGPPSERSLGWVVSRPLTSASVVRISLRFTLVSSSSVMPKSLHEFGRVGCPTKQDRAERTVHSDACASASSHSLRSEVNRRETVFTRS